MIAYPAAARAVNVSKIYGHDDSEVRAYAHKCVALHTAPGLVTFQQVA